MVSRVNIQKKWFPPIRIFIAGLLAAPCCLFLLLIFIGNRTLLGVLVPYATLAEPTLTDALKFFFLAAIQFPLYGTVLAIAWAMSDRYKIMFLLTLVLLITKHYTTAVEAVRIAHEFILF